MLGTCPHISSHRLIATNPTHGRLFFKGHGLGFMIGGQNEVKYFFLCYVFNMIVTTSKTEAGCIM